MSHHRITRSAALGLAIAALAAPTAGAMPADQHSPAAGASTAATFSAPDRQIPDARDVNLYREVANSEEAAVVESPQPVSTAGDGLDWGDVGIGAGAVVAILLVLGAIFVLVQRRRQDPTGHRAARVA